ncbi:uncharacterized protein LOC142348523 [Convolutriloba macropyga]|uniref:uncharacterized protein LOC142348523 n=1 Tax=Convolutriloba macropyga TaxID=536237 RepID=UPI003F524058
MGKPKKRYTDWGVFAYPHNHLEAERRSENFETPGDDVALGNPENSDLDEEPEEEIPVSEDDLTELERLRDYPELYEEYLEELEELQLLDDFVYKLHSLHYTDNEILDILEQLESEAVFEASSQGYASQPEPESNQMMYNEVKRSRSGNSLRGFRYQDSFPEEENEDEEEEESPEDEVDEELKRSNDIDDDLESEFENLQDEMDEAEKSEEDELADEEEMVESELSRDEEESAELMAELEQMEEIAEALRDDGWTDNEIREVFREKFGIDLLFDDEEELEGYNDDEDDDEEKGGESEDEVKRDEDDEEDEEEEEDEKEADEEDDEDELDEHDEDENEDEEEEDEEEEDDENDEDEFEPSQFYRNYPSANQIREYLAEHPDALEDEEKEEEEEMRQRAYPFRKRALEEIKAKKQDLDQDNEGIAGENFWLGSEGSESGEEKKGVKRFDRDMENIYNRLGYLEFQPH